MCPTLQGSFLLALVDYCQAGGNGGSVLPYLLIFFSRESGKLDFYIKHPNFQMMARFSSLNSL